MFERRTVAVAHEVVDESGRALGIAGDLVE
jgi:hypothetical protein